MQVNTIHGGSKALVTPEDTTTVICFLYSKHNAHLHVFSSFWLPSFITTIRHKMDSNMIIFHKKCQWNVNCFHQINNPINHSAALSKSIWWKFACRNGSHSKSNICFINCLDHFLVIVNFPHPGLISLKAMDCIIFLKMGCTILVDNGWPTFLIF